MYCVLGSKNISCLIKIKISICFLVVSQISLFYMMWLPLVLVNEMMVFYASFVHIA